MRSRSAGLTCSLVAAVMLSTVADGRAEEQHDYVGHAKCKTCHGKELMGNQVGEWKKSPHRQAFEILKSPESQAIAEAQGISGPAHEADACLSCHSTAHGVPPARMAYELKVSDGVQCESCHGPGRDYRKKKLMSDEKLAHAKGLWYPGDDDAICTACHNSKSPTWDTGRYTLPDGTTAGFDPVQAREKIAHPIPAHVKGRYIELEKQQKAAK